MKKGVIKRQDILSIIDYSLPSSQKRMWTFDLAKQRLLFREFVAHGMNSGENRTVKFALPKERDRKSTRLNSSHLVISYAVFCLKENKGNGDSEGDDGSAA